MIVTAVGVFVVVPSVVGKNINPTIHTQITQIKIKLMMKAMLEVMTLPLFADAPDPIDGVKDKPEPGIPTVGRMPRLPMFSVLPALPMDVLMPPLLRFNRKPFPSLNIFRNRNGIISPSALDKYDR